MQSFQMGLQDNFEKSRLEPLVGFEPTDSAISINDLVGALSPLSSPDLRLLLRVAEKWPTLNGSLKLAILAIVDAS